MQADFDVLEEDANFLLFIEEKTSMLESDFHGLLIHAFKEPRPKGFMYGHSGVKDFPGERLTFMAHVALGPFCVFVFRAFVIRIMQ